MAYDIEPQITVSILSWLLEDRLIKTLKSIPFTTSIPLNLCLHVQGEEQISREKKQEIYDAAFGFVYQEIYFTPYNNGAAVPRAALLNRSTRTPYVLMTDNDMDFNDGDIDLLYEFLNNPDNNLYGGVNLVDNTLRWHRRVDFKHKRITYFPVSLEHPKSVDINLCGACCTLLRSDVAKLPNIIDTNYYIGTWDIDLCMNIKKLGWKLATICDKDHVVKNDESYRTPEYKKIKGFTPDRLKGLRRFRRKWKITSEVQRDKAMGITVDNVDTAIISRSIYNSLGDRPGVGVLTKYRLNSMQKFFINSLKNQTSKEFSLYIFIGPKENEATKAIKALDWTGLNPKFIYIENQLSEWQDSVDSSGNWGREIDPGCPEDLVRKFGHPNHTIMARLDNDDWVAPGWVAHMKYMSSSIEHPRFLINYQVIGQSSDGRLYKFFNPHTPLRTSPFLTLVQKEGPKISPYAKVHLDMGKLFDVIYTIQPSYVFMVIGKDNRSNRVYKYDKYFEDISTETSTTDEQPEPKPKIEKIIPIHALMSRSADRGPMPAWKKRIVQAES